MLDERKQLIEISRDGFKTLTEAIKELRISNEKASNAVHEDIQKSMISQAGIYKSIADSLAQIKAQNAELKGLLQSLLEKEI